MGMRVCVAKPESMSELDRSYKWSREWLGIARTRATCGVARVRWALLRVSLVFSFYMLLLFVYLWCRCCMYFNKKRALSWEKSCSNGKRFFFFRVCVFNGGVIMTLISAFSCWNQLYSFFFFFFPSPFCHVSAFFPPFLFFLLGSVVKTTKREHAKKKKKKKDIMYWLYEAQD